MARQAREKALYSNYLIKQTNSLNEKIFLNEKDRKTFLSTLETVKRKYNFKLYGVAISPIGYELLLYDNGSDISKIMKSLNISFTMQYKCNHSDCKNLFKERYKSSIIDGSDLINTLANMALCVYVDKQMIDDIDVDNYEKEICIDCFEKAKIKLDEIVSNENITFDELLSNKKWRNSLIKDFRRNSLLSLTELGELFGGLSESGVSKIINK